MSIDPGFHALWPTPLGIHRYEDAEALDPLLVRVFGTLRAVQLHAHGLSVAPFFASDDDLLARVQLPEWQAFVRFLVERLRDTATMANRQAWPRGGIELKIAFAGVWFQCSNHSAFHDVHTHGNCSWSGLYVVQVDPTARRIAHAVHGDANGVTRFYGPAFAQLAGAHVDLGNAYLQPPHIDIQPVKGQLVLFPSWLPHRAMPYDGDRERIVVSFNARLHAADGNDRMHAYDAR